MSYFFRSIHSKPDLGRRAVEALTDKERTYCGCLGIQSALVTLLLARQVRASHTPTTTSLDVPNSQYRSTPVNDVYKPCAGDKRASEA
jgi:hypothetical protein